MEKLKGFQRKYLRGLANSMKPVVFIGQKGLTPALRLSTENALNRHELIKVKFTPTLHKYLVQKRFARSISGHQETIAHFQDLTVC
jgi:RNA-binding protein YhbY